MSVYGTPIGGASLAGSAISLEDYRRLRIDVNRCLAHIDDVQDSTADILVLEGNVSALEATDASHTASLSSHQSAIDDLGTAIGNIANLDIGSDLVSSANTAHSTAGYALNLIGLPSLIGPGANISASLDSLDTTVSGHGTSITSLSTSVSTLTTGLSVAESEIDSLQTLTSGHTGDISVLTSGLTTAQSDITALETLTSGHTGDIAALNNADALHKAFTGYGTTLLVGTELADSVNLLKTIYIDGHTTDITALQSGLTSTDANVATLTTSLTSTDGNVATLSSSLSTLSTTYSTEIGDVAYLPNTSPSSNVVDNIVQIDDLIDDLTFAHQYCCQIYRNGTHTGSANITFTATEYDHSPGGAMADIANSRIICQRTGLYLITTRMFTDSNTDGGSQITWYQYDSTDTLVNLGVSTQAKDNEGTFDYWGGCFPTMLTSGDYVFAKTSENDSSTYGSTSSAWRMTRLSVDWIGDP